MLDYWKALGLVSKVENMDHPAVANLAQKSEPEKWQSEVYAFLFDSIFTIT